MKITNNVLLLAAVVAISLVTILKAAPLPMGMNPAQFHGVQNCLYDASLDEDKDSLCYRLLNPTYWDKFTPEELPLRYVFYTEAALLWSMFKDWSDCFMLTWNMEEEKLCKPRLSDYNGFYTINFEMDTYDLVSRFKADWLLANPLVDSMKHCMHFHASDSNSLTPQYAKGCSQYARYNWDNVQDTYAKLSFYVKSWIVETFEKHGMEYPARNQYDLKEMQDVEAIYMCLHSPWTRDSDESDQKEFCRSIVNPETTARASNFSSFGGVSLEGLNRTEQHYVEFVRAHIVYDCLRYHRHERVHWCEDVKKHVARRTADDGSQYDRIIDKVIDYMTDEREHWLTAWLNAGNGSPFKMLPSVMTELCQLYSVHGDVWPRPQDCEEGGLYSPFL